MSEKMTHINHEILSWASKIAGFSVQDVYGKFTNYPLDEWEKGTDFPTYSQLSKLMDFYHKPIAVAFFPSPPEIKDLISSFRTLTKELYGIFTPRLRQLLDNARAYQLSLYELNGSVNANIEHFHKIQTSHVPFENIPEVLRSALEAPLTEQFKLTSSEIAFDYWREKLLSIGVYVFMDAFTIDDISGFCLEDSKFPVIYINNSTSNYRQVFTLFHELCHLLTGIGGITFVNDALLERLLINKDLQLEKFCNRFAAEFLIPEKDFRLRAPSVRPSIEIIKTLSNKYNVSREVVARKYLDLALLTPTEYSTLVETFNQEYLNYRKKQSEKPGGNFYSTHSKYMGKAFIELVFSNYFSGKIDITQTSDFLNMQYSSVQKLAARSGWGSL